MARQVTTTADPEWLALFENFEHSAYRLEGLQHYSSPEEAEAFAQFCAGNDPGLDLSWVLNTARAQADAGRRMTRVRVIVEPVTDYTRFELVHYPAFVEAGDDIRIIVAPPGGWPPGLPRHDYWLFDDQQVWAMSYDHAGTFVSATELDDPRAVAEHRRWRDMAIAQSVPLHAYLAARASARAS
jgi:hypothetical protein